MSKPPKISLGRHDPLQDYYHDGNGNSWSVARLQDVAKELPVFDCPLASIDLSHQIWQGSDIVALAAHCKRVTNADLDCPILLDWAGSIADGRHRVMRALIEGKRTIKARRMTYRPEPERQAS